MPAKSQPPALYNYREAKAYLKATFKGQQLTEALNALEYTTDNAEQMRTNELGSPVWTLAEVREFADAEDIPPFSTPANRVAGQTAHTPTPYSYASDQAKIAALVAALENLKNSVTKHFAKRDNAPALIEGDLSDASHALAAAKGGAK